MSATDYRQPIMQPFPLQRLRVPMLTIYTITDYHAVHVWQASQELEWAP